MLKLVNSALDANTVIVQAVQQRGWDGTRVSLQTFTDDSYVGLLQHLVDMGTSPLVVVWSPEQARNVPKGCLIEAYNEPNLSEFMPAKSPQEYADAAKAILEVANCPVYVGVVSNMEKSIQDYLGQVLHLIGGSEGDYRVSTHRYPYGENPSIAATGFANRSEEFNAFRALIGTRQFGCSEVGYWTAPRTGWYKFWGIPIWKWTRSWTLDQIAGFMAYEVEFWSARHADFMGYWQLNSGPNSNSMQDTFGIRDVTGLHWYPASDLNHLPNINAGAPRPFGV